MSSSSSHVLHGIPFVKILFPFLLGDLAGLTIPHGIWMVFIAGFVGLALLIFSFSGKDIIARYSRGRYSGPALFLLFFSVGILAALLAENRIGRKTQFCGDVVLSGYIYQPAVEKKNSLAVLILSDGFRKDTSWYKVRGRTLLYFHKDSKIASGRPGDAVIIHTKLRQIPFSGNPGEFNYRRYQNDHGIYWEAFVNEEQWTFVSGIRRHSLLLAAKKIQLYLVDCLKKQGFTREELAVASALTAGDKEFLDPETKSYFSDSGTMHILAISGLHVGIIYLVFLYFFSLFGQGKKITIIRTVVIIFVLWGYAFITGLSPSVMRAALMFSFFLLGNAYQRKVNVYNILAVSAFILLVIQPVTSRNTGFQLSYLAVLGIVAFYKPLYRIAASGWWLTDKMWSLIAVSLAAQIGTFPITLFYFHKFPLYFPLANLFVVPVVTLFIYTGLVFFIFQPLPVISSLAAYVLKELSAGLLDITQKIQSLPGAVIQPVWLHRVDIVVLYLLIITLVLFIKIKKPVYLISFQIFLLTGILMIGTRETQTSEKKRFVVFNIPGSGGYLLSAGRIGVIGGIRNKKGKDYYLKNLPGVYGLKKIIPVSEIFPPENQQQHSKQKTGSIYFNRGFFEVGNITGYILTDSTMQRFKKELTLDYLVISGRKWWLVEKQLTTLHPQMIILDASVPVYAVSKIRKICGEKNIFTIREQGPFIYEE